MEKTIISIFTGIVIAFFSSWITVKLSLKKFQKERRWERKLETYTCMIESLHNLKEYMANEEDFVIAIRDKDLVPSNETMQWEERYRAAKKEILKFKDISALIIPDGATSLLNKYYIELETVLKKMDYEDGYTYINTIYTSADTFLKKFIEIAKRDLKRNKA